MKADDFFKLYFSELKDIYSGYVAFEITMSLSIITILSWFLTSAEAKETMIASKSIKLYCIIAILLTALAELYVVILVFNTSSEILNIVKRAANSPCLNYPQSYYKYRVVDFWTIVVFYSFHVLLLALLSGIIIKTKKRNAHTH